MFVFLFLLIKKYFLNEEAAQGLGKWVDSTKDYSERQAFLIHPSGQAFARIYHIHWGLSTGLSCNGSLLLPGSESKNSCTFKILAAHEASAVAWVSHNSRVMFKLSPCHDSLNVTLHHCPLSFTALIIRCVFIWL